MNHDNLSPSCLSGQTTQTISVCISENGQTLNIGPVELLVREYDTAPSLWLLVHPCISAFLLQHIECCGYSVLEAPDVCHFSIRGISSDSLLHSLFSTTPNTTRDNTITPTTFQPRVVAQPYFAPEYYSQDSMLHLPHRVYFPPATQPPPPPPPPSPALLIHRHAPSFGRALAGFDVLLPRTAVHTFWTDLCALRPIVVMKLPLDES